jgi:mycothiol system anti-sigma-R factor
MPESSDPEIDCQEAVHTLYHFLDGELTDGKRQEIQQHLDDCSPCLEVFDFEAELRAVISKKCRDQVPEHVRIRILEAIRVGPGPVQPGDGNKGIPTI